MKFINWSKEKIRRAASYVFRHKAVAPTTIPASAPTVHSEPAPAITYRIKPDKKKSGNRLRLPQGIAVGDYVLFPFGKQHVQHGGTTMAIVGNMAKIRMICRAGYRITYRKIASA